MINTIFYFTDSLPYETYQAKMDKDGDDGIASKTIVFAKQQGKIYNNGYSYGITQSEIQQLINASVATSQGKLENDDAVIREALTSLSSDLNGAKGRISTAEQAITTLQSTLSTTQGNLSNYVTLDTDQELTGDKLFRGINQFTFNKLSKDGVLVQSGINTVNVKQSRITSEQITTPKIVVTGQPSDNVLLAGGSSLNLSDQGYASGSAVQDGFDDVNGRLGDLSDAVDDKLSLSTGGTVTGDITANSFIKSGSSNNYVLLGGGGHKPLSEIVSVNPGTTVVHEDYDDTELRTAISNLNTAINDANTTATTEYGKLNNLIRDLDSSIQTKIENLFDDSTWIQQNFPAGTTGGGSNFGQSDVESYLQTLGVWTTDGNGNTVTQWSKLNQDVTSISGRVTQLEGNAATGGNVNYSLLSSSLYSYILDNYTTAGMESTWAKFAQLTNGDMQMLKWMSSGASSYANDATSTANLFAAAKNYSDNGSTISQAVSNINALVERDQNDNLVAKSAMESMVDSAITGIINTATSSQAGTTIFSKVNQNSDDIAAITTKITGDTSSASVATKLGDMTAGLVTTATLDSAAASLISGSANTSLKSAVMTKVSDGITSAQLVAASDYNAASIVAMVNASNDSSIKLSADKITLDGQTVANSISAANITLSGRVEANNFQAGPSNQLNIKTSGDKIQFCDGNTAKAWFELSGSGFQLWIIGEDGNPYKVKWSSWDNTTATYQPLSYYYVTSQNNPEYAFSAAQLYSREGYYYEYNSSTGNYDAITSGTFYTKDVLSVLPEVSESEYETPILYRMADENHTMASVYDQTYTWTGKNSVAPPAGAADDASQGLYKGKYFEDYGLAIDPVYIDVYTEYTITNSSITPTGYKVMIARQLYTSIVKHSVYNQATQHDDVTYTNSTGTYFVVPGPAAITNSTYPNAHSVRTVRTPINVVSSVSNARTTTSFTVEEGDPNGSYIDHNGVEQGTT